MSARICPYWDRGHCSLLFFEQWKELAREEESIKNRIGTLCLKNWVECEYVKESPPMRTTARSSYPELFEFMKNKIIAVIYECRNVFKGKGELKSRVIADALRQFPNYQQCSPLDCNGCQKECVLNETFSEALKFLKNNLFLEQTEEPRLLKDKPYRIYTYRLTLRGHRQYILQNKISLETEQKVRTLLKDRDKEKYKVWYLVRDFWDSDELKKKLVRIIDLWDLISYAKDLGITLNPQTVYSAIFKKGAKPRSLEELGFIKRINLMYTSKKERSQFILTPEGEILIPIALRDFEKRSGFTLSLDIKKLEIFL